MYDVAASLDGLHRLTAWIPLYLRCLAVVPTHTPTSEALGRNAKRPARGLSVLMWVGIYYGSLPLLRWHVMRSQHVPCRCRIGGAMPHVHHLTVAAGEHIGTHEHTSHVRYLLLSGLAGGIRLLHSTSDVLEPLRFFFTIMHHW